MSLWWAKKEQLDKEQLRMIEDLGMRESHLVLGPPGSGKTNVLLRRAQFARTQGVSDVMVLSFTRSLTEFVKTGCFDSEGREIFPRSLVNTIESWTRSLYKDHNETVPDTNGMDFVERKLFLAKDALKFVGSGRIPIIDTIFVDEAQDLLAEEVTLLDGLSNSLFLVGDDRQKIHDYAAGLDAVRAQLPGINEETLKFHYRLAPELCQTADKIQTATGGSKLSSTSLYDGPKPGTVQANGGLTRKKQVAKAAENLNAQLRAYADLIAQGDRLGVIVPTRADRDTVFQIFESDGMLAGKSQIIKARTGDEDDRGYNPAFDPESPIAILTEKGSKGLEFRAIHWLFCDENDYYRTPETYYTVVTRAKTRLDLYFESDLPTTLAKAYSPPAQMDW